MMSESRELPALAGEVPGRWADGPGFLERLRPGGPRLRGPALRVSGVLALTSVLTLAMSGQALADDVAGSYQTSIGAGSSKQYMAWSQSQEKIKLWVDFDGNPSGTGNRCQDALVDWNTNGTGHYDARVVRNCNPGHLVATDPGGDDWWQEPNDYDEADVRRVQRVGSYVFKDNDRSAITNHKYKYGGPPAEAGATSSYAQRIRTLYDSGNLVSYTHFPVRCAGDNVWIDYPGSNGGSCL